MIIWSDNYMSKYDGPIYQTELVSKEWMNKTVAEVMRWVNNNENYSLISVEGNLRELGGLISPQIEVQEVPQLLFINTNTSHWDIVVYYLYEGKPIYVYLCSGVDFACDESAGYYDNLDDILQECISSLDSLAIYIFNQPLLVNTFMNWMGENPLEVKQ